MCGEQLEIGCAKLFGTYVSHTTRRFWTPAGVSTFDQAWVTGTRENGVTDISIDHLIIRVGIKHVRMIYAFCCVCSLVFTGGQLDTEICQQLVTVILGIVWILFFYFRPEIASRQAMTLAVHVGLCRRSLLTLRQFLLISQKPCACDLCTLKNLLVPNSPPLVAPFSRYQRKTGFPWSSDSVGDKSGPGNRAAHIE